MQITACPAPSYADMENQTSGAHVWCSQMQKFMSMSRDDMVVNSLSSSFDKMREWPFCVGSPEGIKDQAFLPRQARLVLALAGKLPSVVCHSSHPPTAVL
jgi:hypothetical protein